MFEMRYLALEALKVNNMAEVVIVMAERAMLATSAMKVDDLHLSMHSMHLFINTFLNSLL